MRRLTKASLCAAVAAVATAALSQQSFAVSYASGVTTSGGNLNFTLNEDAQNVTILLNGVPTSLGAKPAGTVSVPLNGASSWSIQVTQTSGLGFGTALPSFASGNTTDNPLGGTLQAQADSALTRFNSPRGVDVNTNTSDLSLFGRAYVTNTVAAAADIGTLAPSIGATLPARPAPGKGIFVLDAHLQDALNQGNNGLTAGIPFDAPNAASPFRVTVGPDNSIYIADWSDTNGTVYRTDANVSNGSGVNVLAGNGYNGNIYPGPALNHGSIAAVAVTGSPATGDLKLYTLDEDLEQDGADPHTQDNSVWRYDIDNNSFPYTGTPTHIANSPINFVSQTSDVALSVDHSKIYITDSRSNGFEAGITVVDPDGNPVWDSLTASQALGGSADYLKSVVGITISKDGKFVAVANVNNIVWVMPVDPATGLPDISKRLQFNGFGTTNNGRDIAFDAADNLYVVSSGYQALRVFSPGGTSVTTLSSDGTFASQNAYTPEWQAAGSGTATTAANWPMSIVPSGSGSFVKFGSAITSNATVTLGANTTYGSIIFDNTNNSYTISGNTLTLNSPSYQTAPTIYVNGNHTINSNLAISRTATAQVNTGSVLTLGGTLSGSGGLTVNGGNNATGGTVVIAKSGSIGALTVRGNSTVQLTGAATTALKVTGISTSTTSTTGTPPVTTTTYTGTLDITSGKVLLNYSATATGIADSVRAQVANAYAGGAWTGQGISSSSAANDPQHIHAIGYVEAADKLGLSGTATASWNGQSADATALLIAYTYKGDANLDLSITPDDFALLDKGYARYTAGTIAANSAHWSDGDFNYDGVVDSNDYLALDTTKGKLDGVLSPDLLAQRDAQFGDAYVASLIAAVPEPTSLAACGLAALALTTRRRRHA